MNYPDPGNLRTNKKKDVRARLKCLGILLKQRQKEVDLRQHHDLKFVRLNQDQDVLEEKLQRAQARILDLEKEKSAL